MKMDIYITEIDKDTKKFKLNREIVKEVLTRQAIDFAYIDNQNYDFDDRTNEEIEQEVEDLIFQKIGKKVKLTFFPTLDLEGEYEETEA